MIGNDPSAVVDDVKTLFGLGAVGGLTDGQLLERFVGRRDPAAEAAFGALVQRHGPMVWGVCLRILNDPHAAADAFQATFLVLVRNASAVRVDDSLGRWLYGVSRRVAVRARRTAARRTAREVGGIEDVAAPDPAPARSGLLAVLDDEIARLPERYRAAVVLCDLEDMSHEEAARELGCAVGTVGSRVARGRERLRDRLTRRGLLLPAGPPSAAAPWLVAAAPAVPRALIDSTARAAAGDLSVVATQILALAKGTQIAMLWNRLKPAAALAFLAAAGLTVISLVTASEPKAKAPPPAAAADPPARSPKAILADAARTYAEARSYEDEGEVTQVFHGPMGKRTVKRPFSTKFVRPKLYRYEFSERDGDGEDERKRYVIWSDAAPERSKHWWTVEPKVQEDTLMMAVAGAIGVSGGSAATIPALLMPDVLPFAQLPHLSDLKAAGDEAVDGSPCVKLTGKNASGNAETVWIDKATSLVKKLTTTLKIPNATVEQTATYRPRINVEIAPEKFEFEPPK